MAKHGEVKPDEIIGVFRREPSLPGEHGYVERQKFMNELNVSPEVMKKRLEVAERRFAEATSKLKTEDLHGRIIMGGGPALIETTIGGYTINGIADDITFTKGGRSLRIYNGGDSPEVGIHMDGELIGMHDLRGADHRNQNLNVVLQTLEKFSKILEDNAEKPEDIEKKLVDEVKNF